MDFGEDFKALLKDAFDEAGKELRIDLNALALYAQERAAHLATLAGQPGFELALRAERDNVTLRAGIAAVEQADATDQRIVGLIHGALGIAAKALAAV